MLGSNMEWMLRNENTVVREEELREDDVNGEVVREAMEVWRRGQFIKAGVTGLGFAMSVVGIWGDGF